MNTCKECGIEFEHGSQLGAHWLQIFCSDCVQRVEDHYAGFWAVTKETTYDSIDPHRRFAITLHSSYQKADFGIDSARVIHGAIGQMEAEAMVHALANTNGGYVVSDGISIFPHPAYSNDRMDRFMHREVK